MRALLLITLAGCWSTPQVPSSSGMPGLLWMTPAQPWRMTHLPTALVVDGETAIVAGQQGWIGRVDLATGAMIRERRIGPTFTFYDLAKLSDGRWIGVGNDAGVTQAVIVDRELRTTPITLGTVADRSSVHAGVAVMADGGVVIAGKGLPLAIYDPKTWAIRSILASELGWNRPRILGNTLGVTLGTVAYAFDLATGTRAELGAASTVQATARRVALKVYDAGKWFAEVWEDGKRIGRLERDITSLALDGERIVVTAGSSLAVYAITDLTTPVREIAIGPGTERTIGLTIDGKRALVSSPSVLRVVDLTSGAVTPIGAPPWGSPDDLVIGDDGTVLELEATHAWWIQDGKVVRDHAIAGTIGVAHHGDLDRYVTHADKQIVMHGKAATIATWPLDQDPLQVWTGAKTVVIETMFAGDEPSNLARFDRSGTRTEIVAYTYDGSALDVDVESDALIGAGARVHVVHLADGSRPEFTLHAPHCSDYLTATVERGGKRASVYADKDLALWDRTTGKLVAALRFGEDITRPVFVPATGEVVVELVNAIALVDVAANTQRLLDVPDFVRSEISPNGKRLAVAFGNGRIAAFDVDVLRAKLVPQPLATFTMPKACKGPDPFAIPEPIEDYPSEDF